MIINRILNFFPTAAVLASVDMNLKDRTESAEKAPFIDNLHGTGINVRRVHNPGMFMGKGKEDPPAVFALTGGLLALFMLGNRKALKGQDTPLRNLSANLVTAGAASNLRDRTKYGYVVDYFSLPVKKIRNVYLNLGDLMIMAGSLLYIFSGRSDKKK